MSAMDPNMQDALRAQVLARELQERARKLRWQEQVEKEQVEKEVAVLEHKEKAPASYGKSTYSRVFNGVSVDIYRICRLFDVNDAALAHALKKILCPGKRKGGKSERQDIEEAIYSLQRWCEMRDEEQAK